MGRTVTATIEFTYYEDEIIGGDDTPLTNEQLIEYAKNILAEDIQALVLNNELHEIIEVEIEEG